MNEAMNDARSDISSQISTSIDSSISIEKSDVNGKVTSDVRSKLKTSTSSLLKNSKVIQSEKIGKNYFVAVSLKKLPTLKCIEKQNPYLSHIPLVQRASSQSHCEHAYSLLHANGRWNLYSDGWSQQLSPFQFDEFFKSTYSDNIEISSEYSSYKADDVFNLEVTSHKEGFVSILVVYENGKVGVLLENQKVQPQQKIRFPKADADYELIAGLNEKGEATKDLYFVFLSPKRINLAQFEQVDDNLLGENEYRFNDVIKLCASYDFASTLIRTTVKTKIKRFKNVRKKSETTFHWFFSDALKNSIEDAKNALPRQDRWAIVIGLQDYEFSDTVQYSKNSAKLFELLMLKKMGIAEDHIISLYNEDATAKNIVQAVDTVAHKAKTGDEIFFYFSGHGVPVPKQNNAPYLLSYDESPSIVDEKPGLKLSSIIHALSSSKAAKVFAFLDTTFSGATDGVSVFKGVAAPKLVAKRISTNKSKVSVMFAGRDTQTSNMYKAKEHRLFSYFLIDAIFNKNITDMGTLSDYVKTQVNTVSFNLGDAFVQTPLLLGNRDAKF